MNENLSGEDIYQKIARNLNREGRMKAIKEGRCIFLEEREIEGKKYIISVGQNASGLNLLISPYPSLQVKINGSDVRANDSTGSFYTKIQSDLRSFYLQIGDVDVVIKLDPECFEE